MNFRLGFFLLFAMCSVQATEIEKISLPLIPDLQRADIYVLKLIEQPAGILVLCPGCNGNGRDWIQNPEWQQFAQDHKLDLIGISFASEESFLNNGRGYYYASHGSGQLLLDGIWKAYHQKLPLILYGFSGGAHFTSRFAEWKPDRVTTWCAYSAGWWDKPVKSDTCPPALIVCGEEDTRYGASLIFFKQGRALGKPWLWVCVPQTGHSIYSPVENFVRDYFAAVLDGGGSNASGRWVNVDLKTSADPDLVSTQPSITGWLPDFKLLPKWQAIHEP